MTVRDVLILLAVMVLAATPTRTFGDERGVYPDIVDETGARERQRLSWELAKAVKLPRLNEFEVKAYGGFSKWNNDEPAVAPLCTATVETVRPYIFHSNPNLVGIVVRVKLKGHFVEFAEKEWPYYQIEIRGPDGWTPQTTLMPAYHSDHVMAAGTYYGDGKKKSVFVRKSSERYRYNVREFFFLFARNSDLKQIYISR